jgi:hypothetical protein
MMARGHAGLESCAVFLYALYGWPGGGSAAMGIEIVLICVQQNLVPMLWLWAAHWLYTLYDF